MYCVLIEHPMAGLIIYETGGGEVSRKTGSGLAVKLIRLFRTGLK